MIVGLAKFKRSVNSLIHYMVFIFGEHSVSTHVPNKRLETMGSRLKKF
jgi:hypothetical protein